MTNHTVESLRVFESKVIEAFEAGLIRGPVHLSYGNEAPLIEIFQNIDPGDWVLSTWRNHYHALLHGIPEDWLMKEILEGHSISTNSIEHHFYNSAIVGGIPPIAVGIAAGLKRNGSPRRVWCFIGDMCATIGIFSDSLKYAEINDLPITFIIENNFYATNTPTLESWGIRQKEISPSEFIIGTSNEILPGQVVEVTPNVLYYEYERKYPHVGVGKNVVMS